jgi:tight adherence protein B
MLVVVIALCAGLCVASIVGAIALAIRGDEGSVAETRLSTLTASPRGAADIDDSLMIRGTIGGTNNSLEKWMMDRFDVQGLIDQADIKLTVLKFTLICMGCGGVGVLGCLFAPIPIFVAPIAGIILFFVPFLWLRFKSKKRMNRFNAQLPEALEMLSRSLRAGHSLGAGFGLIAGEMADPLAKEFGRCFEEQNLGVSLEQSLESMTQRISNLDLRFFATAVILQRQTGGDLAEILDKIGRLIRARFRLAGQIQALTGEGRLSGIVLLALPPGLFTMMLFINKEYIMKLFTDPWGQWMLGGAIAMQLAGAWCIKKIIDIKV